MASPQDPGDSGVPDQANLAASAPESGTRSDTDAPTGGRRERNRSRQRQTRPILKAVPVRLPPELEAERLRDRALHQAAWQMRFGKPEEHHINEQAIVSGHAPREHDDWARVPHGRTMHLDRRVIDRTAAGLIGRALRDRRIESVDRRYRHTARLWGALLQWVDRPGHARHAETLRRFPCERRLGELVFLGHAPEALLQHASTERGAALRTPTSGALDPDALLLEVIEAWEPDAPRPLRLWEEGESE